jgi:hypothetical protein
MNQKDPNKKYTIKVGPIILASAVGSTVAAAGIQFTIFPDPIDFAENKCKCANCVTYLLTTVDAGIKAVEEKEGKMLPEHMYVPTNPDGTLKYLVAVPSSTTLQ